jgi:hypothetical protein
LVPCKVLPPVPLRPIGHLVLILRDVRKNMRARNSVANMQDNLGELSRSRVVKTISKTQICAVDSPKFWSKRHTGKGRTMEISISCIRACPEICEGASRQRC